MYPKSNQKFFLFILHQAIFSSIYLRGFLCLQFIKNPRHFSDFCPSQFTCGNISSISYPFWKGGEGLLSEPMYCGRPGFMIDCKDNVPMLNIASLLYRVQEINFDTNTLRVARDDLYGNRNNMCPEVLQNTTIDPDVFEIPHNSKDENVTIFYGCTMHSQPPNLFHCNMNVSTFTVGNASLDGTCKDSIFVPVSREAAQSLKNPKASSISTLRDALATGFSVQWREDAKQYKAAVPSQSPKKSQDLPVVRSPPAPAPENGMPPAQSADYPLGSDRHGSSSQTGSNLRQLSAPRRIIVGIVLGTTGIAIVCIVICCFLRKQCLSGDSNQENNQDVENFLLKHGSLALRRFKYFEIKKITKSFTDKLGQGGYGSVYKGTLSDGSLVAVKVLIDINSNGEEFINEVASISRTSHVNIVNLLGFCFDRNNRALVYEFMPNKSLDKFISNNGLSNVDCLLDLEKLYKIAIGVAKGLEYLHMGCNTRIVHFDIKPQNILLDDDFCPKISDFGLAKLCKKKQSILSMIGARGTIGYIAPEIFSRNFGGVSHKSDVYSYGMMILEMAGARKIEEAEGTQSSENYFPDKIYELIVLGVPKKLDDYVIEEEGEIAKKMFLVGFWCIQTNPSDRPSISKVVEMLEGSIQSIQIPPKPILFCPNTLSRREISPSFSEYVETDNSVES